MSGMSWNTANWPKWARIFSYGLRNPEKGIQSGEVGTAPVGLEPVSDERALQISVVFSCIRLIAEICGSLPLDMYERLPGGRRKRVLRNEHWLPELLAEPNPMMTAQEFWESVFAQVCSWGNFYGLRTNSIDKGRVLELWPLKPDCMVVERDGFSKMKYRYSYSGMNSQKDLTQSDVWHVKGFGMDGFMGLSPLSVARQAMGLSVAAENYAGSFYANGGKPSGVLTIDKVLTKEQRDNVRERFGPMAEGGANKLWVLEAGAKYQQITIPPEDAQMLGSRQFQVGELARIFRIPLFLLMEMEKSTSWGSGLEQQDLAFLKYTLRPYLTRVEESIGRWLLTPAERQKYYVEHNLEGLLRADSKARAEFYASAGQNGWMTRNEIREKENRDPMDGGDDLTVQSNLVPIGKLGQPDPLDVALAAEPDDGD